MSVSMMPTLHAASEWFARIRGREADAASEPAWQEFISNPENELALEQREAAFTLSGELAGSPQIEALLAQAERELQSASRVPRRRYWGLAAAAGVAAIAVGIALILRGTTADVAQYDTARAEERVINLADGSVITLNTSTSVRVSYSGHRRQVDLLAGEALFSVAHDASRPFEVHALSGITTAVGTRFDVELGTAGSADVSVLEGTVTVSGTGGTAATPVAVSAGQAVRYGTDGTVSGPHPADLGRIQGWEVHRIVFSDVPLGQALEDYNRYSAVPIVLKAPQMESRHINGVFRIGDEAAFLGALEQGLQLHAVRGPDQIVLEAR
ncbi:MAG: FecR domain-containing protein [Proteobacteria bacterium]|nr:FecR domain-containing protein [Pseudomonadota bacterium]